MDVSALLKRKRRFDAVLRRIWREEIALPRAFSRATCMACGYPTCTGNYAMCWLCEWEDNPDYWKVPDEMTPDARCGINKSSLTDARRNVARYDGRGGIYWPHEPDFERVEKRYSRNLTLRAAYERLLEAETEKEIKEAVRYIRETEGGPDERA